MPGFRLTPLRAGLLLLCVVTGPMPGGAAGTLQAAWQAEFRHEQFEIHSEVAADKVLPAIHQLTQLKQSLEETLKIDISDRPIDILVFSSTSSYRAYVRPRVPEAVNRPALFVKGPDTLWVYVVYRNGWETDLRHESTHALLHASLPYLPLWLDEGLAEYFELPAASQGLNTSYINGVIWRSRLRQKLRTHELEKLSSLSEMRPEHYRDSWAWVYFSLRYSAATQNYIRNYVQTIQREEVAGSYFERFEQQFPQAQSQAQQFLRSQ